MNMIKDYDKYNKVVWKKMKIFFKQKLNNTETLINMFKFEANKRVPLFIEIIESYDSLYYDSFLDEALIYCLKKSKRS